MCRQVEFAYNILDDLQLYVAEHANVDLHAIMDTHKWRLLFHFDCGFSCCSLLFEFFWWCSVVFTGKLRKTTTTTIKTTPKKLRIKRSKRRRNTHKYNTEELCGGSSLNLNWNARSRNIHVYVDVFSGIFNLNVYWLCYCIVSRLLLWFFLVLFFRSFSFVFTRRSFKIIIVIIKL